MHLLSEGFVAGVSLRVLCLTACFVAGAFFIYVHVVRVCCCRCVLHICTCCLSVLLQARSSYMYLLSEGFVAGVSLRVLCLTACFVAGAFFIYVHVVGGICCRRIIESVMFDCVFCCRRVPDSLRVDGVFCGHPHVLPGARARTVAQYWRHWCVEDSTGLQRYGFMLKNKFPSKRNRLRKFYNIPHAKYMSLNFPFSP